jgi:insulysin
MLEGLGVRNSRTILLAKKESFQTLMGTRQWETEPWYGTQYRVERLDEAFVREVRRSLLPAWGASNIVLWQAEGANTIDVFHLPGPNEFIPERLDVDKQEVTQVRLSSVL